jgi:hypothetical protein
MTEALKMFLTTRRV